MQLTEDHSEAVTHIKHTFWYNSWVLSTLRDPVVLVWLSPTSVELMGLDQSASGKDRSTIYKVLKHSL